LKKRLLKLQNNPTICALSSFVVAVNRVRKESSFPSELFFVSGYYFFMLPPKHGLVKDMTKKHCIIAGLGNVGSKYVGTRHNVGFVVADELARRWGGSIEKEKWNAMYGRIQLSDYTIMVLKPTTFMNLSGRAIAEFAHFYKINSANILVIHDDLDMAPARVKLVKGGGAGGHNGIKSITQCIGTTDFYRLKIGIGRPGQGEIHRDFPVEKYVLGAMNDQEMEVLESRFDPIENGIVRFFEDGPGKAMTELNRLK